MAISLDRPKQAAHGDYACNVALQLARALKRPPREIATRLVEALPQAPELEKAEVAGAGFINLFLKPGYRQRVVNRILAAGADYGRVNLGQGREVQVEFVSANPTGPLHVGHGRQAALGDSIAALLESLGLQVQRVDDPALVPSDARAQVIVCEGAVAKAPAAWIDALDLNGRLGVIERDGPVGRAAVYLRAEDGVGRRQVFDATPPVLAGFEAQHGFAF